MLIIRIPARLRKPRNPKQYRAQLPFLNSTVYRCFEITPEGKILAEVKILDKRLDGLFEKWPRIGSVVPAVTCISHISHVQFLPNQSASEGVLSE